MATCGRGHAVVPAPGEENATQVTLWQWGRWAVGCAKVRKFAPQPRLYNYDGFV
jgi:hypothetical protein